MMEEDAQAFIEELERRRGAPLQWRTYATWYANSRKMLREFGVFLYRVENTLYFEDFERTPSMFGINLKPKKKKEPFIKYEGSFAIDEVVSSYPVLKSHAAQLSSGTRTKEEIRSANLFDKTFRQLVEMIILKNGTIHFFELMNRKQFLQELER